MNDSNGGKAKKSDSNRYIKTFRNGAVAANIFARQAPGGFDYLDFGLSRAWKTKNGKDGYSQNFFAKNRDALLDVIDRACQFIESQGIETTDAQRSGERKISAENVVGGAGAGCG